VTSIVRHAAARERSGFLRVVDLEQGLVVAQAPVRESSYRELDPNPRGGYRGAKGLGVHGDRLVVANSERLFVLDPAWRIQQEISDPRMGSVHDILCEEDGILVTCTNCDLLLQVGWYGRPRGRWSWRFDRNLARELGFRAVPPLREDLDYRDPRATYGRVRSTVQLNGLARTDEGVVLSFGRILSPRTLRKKRLFERVAVAARRVGVAPREEPKRESPLPAPPEPGSSYALVLLRHARGTPLAHAGEATVLFRREGVTVPNHNVLQTEGKLVYNDSDRGYLVVLDAETRIQVQAVAVPGSPSFARGLAHLQGGVFVVGSQAPAALHMIDLGSGAVTGTVELSDDPRESVYAVAVLPDSFADPPPDFTL